MGWGFSPQGYYGNGSPPLYQTVINPVDQSIVVVRASIYGETAANSASADQLRVDPVFSHYPFVIFTTNDMDRTQLDFTLGRGVPALSGAMGGGEATLIGASRNRNLNQFSSIPQWPRLQGSSWNGWRHGDVKDIAIQFVFPAFEALKGECH